MLKSCVNLSEKKRTSKKGKLVSVEERKEIISQVAKQLLHGEITPGEALKILRINITQLKQDGYAKMVKMSRKTLSDIENDRGSCTTEMLNRAFKPFGFKVGIIPIA